ncbi:winged helix DNA-binding protein [Niallia sp. 03133]|uniref:winged helix DNA-binding protein n=1 Tax=Niallia sp. 03133 TaxID=3458060 RepID=UPI004043CAF7
MKSLRKFQSEDDEEKQWMLQHCDDDAAEVLKEMTVVMLYVLDAIGNLEPVNGISIANQYDIPKGTVSKITKKLHEKQLIVTKLLPDNKKEIFFSMTSLGQKIYAVHKALHCQIDSGSYQFLQSYNDNELHFLNECLIDTLNASWVSMDEESKARPSISLEEQEREEIMAMLKKLNTVNLKKAKTILKDVFFTDFDK